MTNTLLNNLADTLLAIPSRNVMVTFLRGILTPQELVEISQRLEIVRQLKQGVPQRQIAKTLRVGIATVTRGSREIKQKRFDTLPLANTQ